MIDIVTKRMSIRNFIPDDWRGLQQVAIDKEASKYAAYDNPYPTGEKEIKEITNWFSRGNDFLAVCDKKTHQVIGYLAINSEKPSAHNLGYCFLSGYQAKGYATEACTAIIDYVFNTLKADSFVTGTAILNEPSCKLLAKLGFHKTGESVIAFREDSEGNPIEFTGASYELTRDAWRKTPHS